MLATGIDFQISSFVIADIMQLFIVLRFTWKVDSGKSAVWYSVRINAIYFIWVALQLQESLLYVKLIRWATYRGVMQIYV